MELSLHRVKGVSDWESIAPAERNTWQRIAAATHGFATPANVVTFLGFALSMWGVGEMLAGQFWWAIGFLAIGRLLDIADGFIADRTGTKSAMGELLDATVDKIITVLTVVGMFLAHVAPTWLMGLLILPHLIIMLIVIVDRTRGIKLHPSRLGKTTMLLAWISIPLLLLVKASGLHANNPFAVLVMLFVLVSAAFGFVTANSYLSASHEQQRRDG